MKKNKAKSSTSYKPVGRQGPTKGSRRTTIDDLISSQKLRKVSRVDVRLDDQTIMRINSICDISGYSRTEVLEALVLSGLEMYKLKSTPSYLRNHIKK